MAIQASAVLAAASCVLATARGETDHKIDIGEFALPNTAPNELRFEDPRNIERVVVRFREAAPANASVSYLKKTWPEFRPELCDPTHGSMRFGWNEIDDHFNSTWKQAAAKCARLSGNALEFTFAALSGEYPDSSLGRDGRYRRDFKLRSHLRGTDEDWDVTYRRTLGIRIDGVDPASIGNVEAYVKARAVTSSIRVTLDAGRTTPGTQIALSVYNARILEIAPEQGIELAGGANLKLRQPGEPGAARSALIRLAHLEPEGFFSYDEGLVTFKLDHDAFTISLDALAKQGPVWYEEEGVFVTLADEPVTFEQYLERIKDSKTTAQMIVEREEQSLGSPMNVQPRPHPVAASLGCKHCCQRFWIEPNGDIVLHRSNLERIAGASSDRFKNTGNGRLFFGMEKWMPDGRSLEPGPVLVLTAGFKNGDVRLEQQSVAVPLEKPVSDELDGDEKIVCLVRFRFRNMGTKGANVEIPISYSDNSGRNRNLISSDRSSKAVNDRQVPRSPLESVVVKDLPAAESGDLSLRGIYTDHDGEQVLRCAFSGNVEHETAGNRAKLRIALAAGETRDVVFSVPYIALDRPEEIRALGRLDFDACLGQARDFWRSECERGSQIRTPEPTLDAFHRGHLAFVEITDTLMPGNRDLVNTSVGTSTYGNFTNESAMIIEELDQRGLHDEARRRLNVWLKYQSTAPLKGAFTDSDGVFYGAGGYESGDSYCQHHGWAMWCLAKHYMITRDDKWLDEIAGQIIKGVEWVARQRKETMKDLPHSRGWERGWLAPGGLEDVDDYFYWLSTNTMTYRGVEYVARALEAAGRPEAEMVRREADDYRDALIAGFETARRHSPLVRLRDGRWIPHYPGRLYRRGRDLGWIREVLEGAVYLLLGELYAPDSKQAKWILDDYLDNRYTDPQYGYPVYQPDRNWFDYGGFSQQPCLLAGLMPHIDRDEPEVYIWMFFNAFAACYREDVGGMIEHPHPILGFSNQVAYKTSDEANAVMWLRYMYVYPYRDLLHLGRAIPREWLSDGDEIYATDVATPFGKVSVRYRSAAASGRITAEVNLVESSRPGRFLVRFRHPDKLPVKSATVNGREHKAFDPEKGDVDVTGMSGRIEITARY